jgi:hypothetical protein
MDQKSTLQVQITIVLDWKFVTALGCFLLSRLLLK